MATLLIVLLWAACGLPGAVWIARQGYRDFAGDELALPAFIGVVSLAAGPISLVLCAALAAVMAAQPLFVPELAQQRREERAARAASLQADQRRLTDQLHRQLGLPPVEWT